MRSRKRARSRRKRRLRKRVREMVSPYIILLAALLFKVISSFTSWVRAILLTWGVMDGVASNYFYKEEKLYPNQFLRYARIIANFSGIVVPIVPVIWNIGDGIYSLYLYRRRSVPIEQLTRYGRVLNGSLLAVFS